MVKSSQQSQTSNWSSSCLDSTEGFLRPKLDLVLSMGIPRRLSGKGAWKASNLAVFKAIEKWNVTINGKAGDFWDEEMCWSSLFTPLDC